MTPSNAPASMPDDPPGLRSLVTCEDGETVLSAIGGLTPQIPGTGEAGIIWVTADDGPDKAINQIRNTTRGSMPGSVDVISLDDQMRSTAADSSGLGSATVPFEPSDLRIHTIPDSSKLEQLGSKIMECIDEIQESDRAPVVLIDDLDRLIQSTDLKSVYQFLHILTAQSRTNEWPIRVCVDDDAIDIKAFATLSPLFDEAERRTGAR